MVRRDVKKKPKRAPLPRRHFARAGELIDEPEWGEDEVGVSDVRLARGLSYYNYCDLKDRRETCRKWTIEYASSAGYSSQEVEALEKMEDWRVYNTISAVSRMISRGCRLSPEAVASHDARVREAIGGYSRSQEEKREKKPPAEGPRPDRSRDEFEKIAGEIDSFLDSGEKFSTYDFLTREAASRHCALSVAEYYRPQLSELSSIKPRDLAREGYARLGRDGINKLVRATQSIIDDAERYASNKRVSVVRKPKKRREKSAAEMTKRVQYLSSYPDLQIVSVDPSTIVGARAVWLYNVKYKTVKRIVGESLTVSGSTVRGFDEEKSEQKTLRKPEKTIKLVLDSPSPSLKTILGDLTTRSSPANGRINSDTVILRVVK